MIRYIIVSLAGGILFGTMDGIIHANPLALKLYEVYRPIMKTSVNAPAGIIIDLFYGFAMAGIFLLLYNSLPGGSGIWKGLVFTLIVWFFRVFMSAASSWMMYNVPLSAIGYGLAAGLLEMLVLGILFGLALKPLL